MTGTTQTWFLDEESREEWPDGDDVRGEILDTISDIFYVVDRRGRFIDWNERFPQRTGYSDAEIADLHEFEIIPDAYESEASELLDAVAAGREVTLEAPLVTKDGEWIPHEFSAAPLTDDDGAVWGMVGTARDISELVETQEKLRERDRRFSTLVSNLPGIVYQCENEPGWPISFVSDGCRGLTGYDPERVESGDISWDEDILHPDDRERLWETVQTEIENREPFTVTYRIITADGDVRWLWEEGRGVYDDTGELEALEGYIADITERKEREQDLERYKTLIDAVGDGVVVVDEDRTLQRCNETLAELLGYGRAELEGMHMSELVVQDLDQTSSQLRQSLRDGDTSVVSIEGEAVRKDGETIPVEGRYSFLPTEDNETTIGLVRDISDRKERAALFERLHEGTRELMDVETVTEVAVTAASVIGTHFDSKTTGMWLLRDGHLDMVAVETDDEQFTAQIPAYEVGEGIVGAAYEQGEPVVYNDLSAIERDFEYAPAGSVMLLPIDDYGLISIGSTETDAFDETDLELGRLFVADVEAAFERADREEQLRTRKAELERYETLVETMGDGVYMTDSNNCITMVNDAMVELTGYSRSTILGMEVTDLADAELAQRGEAERQRLIEGSVSVGKFEGLFETASGSRVPVENRFAKLPSTDCFEGTAGVVRDVTEQKEREDRLKSQRDELETLNRINELIQETIGALASAATREDIESTVCERLAGSSLYRFTFTGLQPPDDKNLEPQAWAGEGAEYLSAVEIPAVTSVADAGPAARALESGDVTVTHDIQSDPLFEPYREAALEHGFRSVAVIPFTYREVVHGLVAVYADRPGAFSQREIQAFEVLGEMVGFAISATQNRRLIESDSHLELTFRLTGTQTLTSDISAETGCSCRLLGSAEASDEGMLHYVSITGADSEEVMAAATDSEHAPEEIRLIRATDDETILEIRFEDSVPSVLLNSGLKPTEVVGEDGEIRVVAQGPPDSDIRTAIDRLEAYGDVTLVSKQEVDSWEDQTEGIREQLRDSLTDRQRAALNAAYFGGYFDWPRDSTAEEVAESLDISSATLHQHLRHAQRKLLSAYLADTSTRAEGT